MDVLSDILSQIRLRGSVFLNAEFREPWGMDIPQGKLGILHIITQGSCLLRKAGGNEVITLNQGDLVLLPRGDAHCLMHGATGNTIPAEEILAAASQIVKGPLRYGGKGRVTNFLCGAFEYDPHRVHPLIESLPDLIHIRGSESNDFAWLSNASYLLNKEAETELLGSSAIVDRLSEVIFSQILRVYIQQTPTQKGFLNALKDEIIVEALRLIHTNPENKWTIAALAHSCGVSRSGLADRFKHQLGDTPMNYLTLWRIQKAQELLIQTNHSTAQISEQVGYHSESAFANAFKKLTGKGPGLFRREVKQPVK